MGELETIMEDCPQQLGLGPSRALLIADVLDSPRKQEHVYLLVESQKKSVARVQKVPKFKKYVENINEARIHLKSLVMKKGGVRMKTKRTTTHTILWPPKYTTNAAEDAEVAEDEGRTRRLNCLYYA
ncbi:hypothetical protein Mapa_003216 [Marchantia paleacea]|nr:hypothetical protein Mapa_003216 [Marchantia paleacea]